MENKLSESVQAKNEKSLRKAYKALDENIFCTTNISVNDSSGLVGFFRGVDIVLNISPTKSYIEIELKKKKDLKIYEGLSLENIYYVYEATMDYQEHNDFQTSISNLVVTPEDSKYKITIRLKPR